MKNLFKKAIIITDIHFGLKSNSILHNEDCLKFIKWVVEEAKKENCETCLFLGDWHNNRASISIITLNYSLRALEILNENFSQVFFIPGNHDLYYRDKRDVKSIEWAKHLKNIKIINDFTTNGNTTIIPWLVGKEFKKIKRVKSDYVFGHFELPHFKMNAMVDMPDNGDIKREDFHNAGHVFSGHFHKRQTYKNITYIGNCFPHNYADVGDAERGCMILKWGEKPIYRTWPDQPTYAVYHLNELLADADNLLKKNMHVRVNVDSNVSYEEVNFIKETFTKTYGLREITLIPAKEEVSEVAGNAHISFETVDQIVTKQLSDIQSDTYDRNLLLSIYKNL